jgi:cytochrome c oxidase subunit 2
VQHEQAKRHQSGDGARQRRGVIPGRGAALLVSVVAFACGSGSEIAPEPGKQVFNAKGCNSCHSVDGSDQIGPTLKAAFGKRVQLTSGQEVVFDEEYFVESVLEPDAKMVVGFANVQPSYKDQIDDHEMTALIAFVKSK